MKSCLFLEMNLTVISQLNDRCQGLKYSDSMPDSTFCKSLDRRYNGLERRELSLIAIALRNRSYLHNVQVVSNTLITATIANLES